MTGYGQVLYGSLTGTVEDSSGAAVTGAKVVVLNVNTGVAQSATTDASGIYRFTTLLPGAYKITISAPNFASQVTDNVASQRKCHGDDGSIATANRSR